MDDASGMSRRCAVMSARGGVSIGNLLSLSAIVLPDRIASLFSSGEGTVASIKASILERCRVSLPWQEEISAVADTGPFPLMSREGQMEQACVGVMPGWRRSTNPSGWQTPQNGGISVASWVEAEITMREQGSDGGDAEGERGRRGRKAKRKREGIIQFRSETRRAGRGEEWVVWDDRMREALKVAREDQVKCLSGREWRLVICSLAGRCWGCSGCHTGQTTASHPDSFQEYIPIGVLDMHAEL
jgi:hypothetical protein